MGQAAPRAFDLAVAGFAGDLIEDLGDHADTGGAHRVAARLEAAGEIERYVAAERGGAALEQLDSPARLGDAEVLGVDALGDREAVVALQHV